MRRPRRAQRSIRLEGLEACTPASKIKIRGTLPASRNMTQLVRISRTRDGHWNGGDCVTVPGSSRIKGGTDNTECGDSAIVEEVGQLHGLVAAIVLRAPQLEVELELLARRLGNSLQNSSHPFEAECAVERFARGIRRCWLAAVNSAASLVYRSPTWSDAPLSVCGRRTDFGYERDLCPDVLEQRCATFFDPPLHDWADGHLLFSSGQAAMTAALWQADAHVSVSAPRPLKVAHVGSYFETRELLNLCPSLFQLLPGRDVAEADIFIVEPCGCERDNSCVYSQTTFANLSSSQRNARYIIVDSTLAGRQDGLSECLKCLELQESTAVLRVHSGLKLFQAGLELADVGILSVYSRQRDGHASLMRQLRAMRTLLGIGLRFGDVAALEAPWFLDRQSSDPYEAAIRCHNMRLATAVSAGKLFELISHPNAPYCTFRLRDGSLEAYDALEKHLAEEVVKRRLLFDRGGSFGFRGHRYEVVRPQSEDPYLRVAMGGRGGWSCEGITALFADISRMPRLPTHSPP